MREEFQSLLASSQSSYKRIISNLPETFLYQDPHHPLPDGRPSERIGRIILAGGELLIDGVREGLLYPCLDEIQNKYWGLEARITVQTTGDLLTLQYIEEMLERGVWMIAVSGMDDFHVGLEGDKRLGLMERIRGMMAAAGVREVVMGKGQESYLTEAGPFFLFFGAQPKSWIGEIWPRGRAWSNSLSSADYSVNFCARWSGGKNFLNHGQAGAEVAIEPSGDVYPCCMKTKVALGNLTEERLTDILDSLKGHPAFEAINAGDPERMGEYLAWDRARFQAESAITRPDGAAYANLCMGCDAFFAAHLGEITQKIRADRLAEGARRLAARKARFDPTAGLFPE